MKKLILAFIFHVFYVNKKGEIHSDNFTLISVNNLTSESKTDPHII